MSSKKNLAKNASQEIQAAWNECIECGYQTESRSRLWEIFRNWTKNPSFGNGFNELNAEVLNHLAFVISDWHIAAEGWSLVGELCEQYSLENNTCLKEMLRESCLEIVVEPPADPSMLQFMFKLAENPSGLGAVLEAFKHYPWLLRPYAKNYSRGLVTSEECDRWLEERGYAGFTDPEIEKSERSNTNWEY